MLNNYESLNINYWNHKFKQDKLLNITSDWLLNFENVKAVILHFFSEDSIILIVGCGNSDFSSKLYDIGYKYQTNIDISDIVINHMQEKNKNRIYQTWDVGNVLDMTYSDNTFDIIFDKSLFDCMLYLHPNSRDITIKKMLNEYIRVLKKNSIYIFITTYPYTELKYLFNKDWLISVDHYVIECDEHKNIYTSVQLHIFELSQNNPANMEHIYIYKCKKL